MKVTLHYDTTSHNSIDGEWSSVILNFSDGQKFWLRPLFFAFENRNPNYESLIVETYERLAAAASEFNKSNIQASDLWGKTDAFMSDAVAKNFEIEKTVPNVLHSDHEPYHILCKSHTVEKLDKTNLFVLINKLERDIKLREKFESVNPALKPFFRGKDAIVEAGIHALQVSHIDTTISSGENGKRQGRTL